MFGFNIEPQNERRIDQTMNWISLRNSLNLKEYRESFRDTATSETAPLPFAPLSNREKIELGQLIFVAPVHFLLCWLQCHVGYAFIRSPHKLKIHSRWNQLWNKRLLFEFRHDSLTSVSSIRGSTNSRYAIDTASMCTVQCTHSRSIVNFSYRHILVYLLTNLLCGVLLYW